jgi:hypothetical protein
MGNQNFTISVGGRPSFRFLIKYVNIFVGYMEDLNFLYYESIWQKTEIRRRLLLKAIVPNFKKTCPTASALILYADRWTDMTACEISNEGQTTSSIKWVTKAFSRNLFQKK